MATSDQPLPNEVLSADTYAWFRTRNIELKTSDDGTIMWLPVKYLRLTDSDGPAILKVTVYFASYATLRWCGLSENVAHYLMHRFREQYAPVQPANLIPEGRRALNLNNLETVHFPASNVIPRAHTTSGQKLKQPQDQSRELMLRFKDSVGDYMYAACREIHPRKVDGPASFDYFRMLLALGLDREFAVYIFARIRVFNLSSIPAIDVREKVYNVAKDKVFERIDFLLELEAHFRKLRLKEDKNFDSVIAKTLKQVKEHNNLQTLLAEDEVNIPFRKFKEIFIPPETTNEGYKEFFDSMINLSDDENGPLETPDHIDQKIIDAINLFRRKISRATTTVDSPVEPPEK